MPVGRCPLPPQNERHNSLAFKRKPGPRDRSRRTGAPERAWPQSRIAAECLSLFYEATDRRSTARQTIREPFGRRSRPNADAIRSAGPKCRLRNRLEAQRKNAEARCGSSDPITSRFDRPKDFESINSRQRTLHSCASHCRRDAAETRGSTRVRGNVSMCTLALSGLSRYGRSTAGAGAARKRPVRAVTAP